MNIDKTFDQKLLEIPHYKLYNEMLPYIGSDFKKKRILLISESHFAPEYKEAPKSQEWYAGECTDKEILGNVNTRNVIGNYFKEKGHRLFSNIESVLKETNADINLNEVAWYNFYQRPAEFSVEIKPAKIDSIQSLEVFEKNLEIIEPKVVLFLSKNAFNCLQHFDKKDRVYDTGMRAHKYKNYDIKMQSVPHPNSVWWNKKSGDNNETGRERMLRLLNKYV